MGSSLPKIATGTLTFATPFSTTPKVILGNSLVDHGIGAASYEVQITSVTNTGFSWRL